MSSSWTLETEAPLGRGLQVRRWRAPSGLALLCAVDRAAPVVSFQTWFRVGSRHEQPGRTGMAHLFEHLMFNQTETLPPGEIDRVIERTGGESNAATWVDWTYYRLSLPARDLELAVRLEAERMTRLVLDEGPVEAERDVVTNERRERVEDDVDGWLDEQLMATAFTVHPYRWPTIGWMEDIRALPLPDIHAFYRTWYAPNNATLVVVGDVDEPRLLELVEAAYGAIPAATLPDATPPIEPPQTEERLLRAGKPIASDRLLCGWKAPGQGHPDWAVLDLLATILAGSPSTRLYRRLVVEREIASTVDTQLTPFRDPSLIRVAATLARGHRAEAALAEIDDVIAGLVEHPVPEAELAKAKNLVETDFWAGLTDADGKAEALGHHETALGDFRSLTTLAERLAAVTAADVQRVARDYLRRDRRTVVIAEPDGDAPDDGDDGGDGDDAAGAGA
ncbi:MAG: insulinase family protein [Kofleriaceae bacterium]|nr:insulinase family protein [Myxococcales bacterium]MCB9563250.1 insulinase family protein [Kofleriaceae bacterium]